MHKFFSLVPCLNSINHYSRRSSWISRGVLIHVFALVFALGGMAQTRPAARPRPATPAKPAPEAPKREIFVSKVLTNGLEIVVYEDHSVPLVTVEYANKAGSFVETPAESGYSHLMEHMFFRSNRAEKEREDYVMQIPKLGISYNGTTREEVCSEYLTGTSNNLNILLHYLRDAVRYPLFLPEELEREEQVVVGEGDRSASNPYSKLSETRDHLLFSKYPNRKEPLGDLDVVRKATPELLKAFWQRYWVPNNSVVIVTGDVKPEDAFKLVEQYFGDWPRAADPFVTSPLVEHPPLEKSAGAVLEGPIQDVIVALAWQGPSIGKDTTATYSADTFDFILTQAGSRFQRALVDSGLANSVDLTYYTQRNVGPITIIMQTSQEKVRPALKALQNEIAHFADPAYFSDQELQNAKTLLGANELYGREKTSEYTHTLAFWWASTGSEYYKGYQSTLASVTRADIRKYLDTYIIGKPRIGVVMLPPEAQKQVHLTANEVVGQ
jgi:zinc protease